MGVLNNLSHVPCWQPNAVTDWLLTCQPAWLPDTPTQASSTAPHSKMWAGTNW